LSLPRRARRSAFTLVEVALATSLLAFLLAALGGLLTSSGRLQTGWQERVQPAVQGERALARWARELESAQAFFGLPFGVEGSAMEFAVVAQTPTGEGGAPQPEWLRVRYAVEEGAFVRESYLWRDGAAALTREVLAPMTAGQFAVGLRDPETSALQWASPWSGASDEGPRLARLVRFEGAFPSSGGRTVAVSRIVRHPAGVLPEAGP
jgi:hypothetical protein